jgi:hypothetical protein
LAGPIVAGHCPSKGPDIGRLIGQRFRRLGPLLRTKTRLAADASTRGHEDVLAARQAIPEVVGPLSPQESRELSELALSY